MREVPLTRGYVALVDDDDYDNVMQYKWSAKVTQWTVYAQRSINSSGKVYLHRYVLTVDDPKIIVDHENHNGLDCQKNNLRTTQATGNARNVRKQLKPTSSQYKGVCWDSRVMKWAVCIHVNNETVNLGTYDDEVLAAQAYDAAAVTMFKDFACLNFAR
jgi:hypothetical protein